MNAADKNTAWGELQTANARYYSILTSDELDTLVTGLELNHSMQPVSLSIGQPLTQSMTGYIAGTQAGQSPAPAGSAAAAVTADQVDTTAAGNALLQQFLAADLVPSYDQPGYLQTSDVTFSCSGEASNFLSLLDDLADNYPSIQLQNFSITTRSFAAADGTSSSGSIYNVTLRVVLCDKGGVQP